MVEFERRVELRPAGGTRMNGVTLPRPRWIGSLRSRATRRAIVADDGGRPCTEKAGGDPVTEADRASERLYRGAARLGSPIPIISEESSCHGRAPRRWQRWWLVDPLDGTKEFLADNGSSRSTSP